MFNSTKEFSACIFVRGKPVTEVVHNGKTFIEGRRKSPYELFFRNNTPQQVLVVPSVDGLGVVDGEAAGKESPGYVVSPHSEVTIPGWTVNGEEAAEFIFHTQGSRRYRDKTYVEAMGKDPRNQGAIGFMVFRSRYCIPSLPPRPPVQPSFKRCMQYQSSGAEAYSASHSIMGATTDSLGNDVSGGVCSTEDSLGTGFGEAVEFGTQKVRFIRESNPCAVFAFFYDTLRNLRKMGVPVEQFNRHYTESYDSGPDPFPKSPEVSGYAKAPSGWTGRRRRRHRTRS